MIVTMILAQNFIKLLFRINMTRETRKKKAKKDDRERYRFAYERVLIETMTRQHKENEIKRMKEVIQKKKTLKTKKMITIEKKRVHMKEMIIRKRKRKKAKIIKKLEKISKSKRSYRRRLFASAISEQESSISVQTFDISKNSILSVKKTRARSFTSS
jgi:16S rRNA C967 or C1407 C5-methylase (RsmB/RsmF family)